MYETYINVIFVSTVYIMMLSLVFKTYLPHFMYKNNKSPENIFCLELNAQLYKYIFGYIVWCFVYSQSIILLKSCVLSYFFYRWQLKGMNVYHNNTFIYLGISTLALTFIYNSVITIFKRTKINISAVYNITYTTQRFEFRYQMMQTWKEI